MGEEFDCRHEVECILNGDNQICSKLYNDMMSFLVNLNKTGKLKKHTLNDIAQNAMMKFLVNLQENRFQFQSTLATYLKAIAKNEYYKYFEKKKELLPIEGTLIEDELAEELNNDVFIQDVKWRIFKDEFEKLPDECQNLLRFYIEKLSKYEIAKRLEYKNAEMVRERLYRCKLKLVQMVRKNSLYTNINDYDE